MKKPTHSCSNKVAALGITVAAVAAVAAFAATGCDSSGVVVVPADHYDGDSTTSAINAEHVQCAQCHADLYATFSQVSDGSGLMSKHLQAWQDYQSGTADADAKALIDANKQLMQDCFAQDSNGQDCAKCHVTAVSSEGQLQAVDFNDEQFCLTCHDEDSLVEATANWGGDSRVNPHKSHLGTISCDNCHKMHAEKDTMYCDECHDWGMPEGDNADGWETALNRYSQVR